ncbi:MFS transporter [Pontibacter beigongshangensis]|uniref:MFS transporter n=1 Tax=Pontibacter beigongshangensis TaxID=2574733 RepID=UPI001650A24B|nr:MFS transporter [Pontibacter beigongshangensis]
MAEKTSRVYGLQFGLLCLSSFLFFASFNMLIPELPNYLTSLGGAEYKGLIISLFTLTAGLSRPFSGKLADKIGRIPVMVVGGAVCLACGFLYPLTGSVAAFLLLRFVHGFSTGFTPTGIGAYVADIIPVHRRGEATGLLGLAGSLGMAAGPAMGGTIANHFSLDIMFYASSALAFLAVAVVARMPETLDETQKFRVGMLKITRKEIFEPRVFHPSLVMFFTIFSFGAILTVVPDFSEHLGIQNKGLFFTSFTLSSLAVRFLAGRLSDKYGRITILRLSAAVLVLALVWLGMAKSAVDLLTAAAIFGLASGMNSPTIFAWTIDLSHEAHRGRAMATMYIALEAGIGIGALSSSWIYNNQSANFPLVFFTCAGTALLAFLYLMLLVKKE